MVIPLGPALLQDSSGLPEGSGRATLLPRSAAGDRPPIWPCSGWGLPSQPVAGLLVRSYRTISPLPRGQPSTRKRARAADVAVSFLWHFPWGCPRWALPTTLPCGVRTFLPGLANGATTRPTPARNKYSRIRAAWQGRNSQLDRGRRTTRDLNSGWTPKDLMGWIESSTDPTSTLKELASSQEAEEPTKELE